MRDAGAFGVGCIRGESGDLSPSVQAKGSFKIVGSTAFESTTLSLPNIYLHQPNDDSTPGISPEFI